MSLLVKTYLAISPIPNAGIGCFAAEFIPKGAKIWELNTGIDRVFNQMDLDRFSELEIKFIKMYAYKHHDLYFLCVDNSRFFNHHDADFNTDDRENTYETYAKKDIQSGEEIISNYHVFGSTNEDAAFNAIL